MGMFLAIYVNMHLLGYATATTGQIPALLIHLSSKYLESQTCQGWADVHVECSQHIHSAHAVYASKSILI